MKEVVQDDPTDITTDKLLNEINRIRLNSTKYCKDEFEDDWPDKDLMKMLRSDSKAPALNLNESLQNAALDHANDMAATGITSHTGSDGSNFKERIERYALVGGYIYQSIVY